MTVSESACTSTMTGADLGTPRDLLDSDDDDDDADDAER